ncbi:MAG: RnfH family protein [Betaproteobacteria bacterium]|nr:RnfH family protein [Betaproteobacteria bacterium]MBI2958901.1 RnfH family protein [Betaproteobacteria bacterium]
MSGGEISVEVACALGSRQETRALKMPPGSTVIDAVLASGLLPAFPEIALDTNRLGIFGRLVRADAPLRDGDRVEIYRPLAADPKDIRRRRARKTRPPGR